MGPSSTTDRQSGGSLLNQAAASPRFHLFIITLFAVTMIFSKLGGNGLANYDDCFYAQKAKEILQTGSWMTMHYNSQPAFENSPLYMWFVAASYKMFGINDYAAKFPSALFGVGTILLVYFIARRVYGDWAAFASSFILSTTFVFTRYARHAMIDVTLSFFFCAAMLALLAAVERDRRYFLVWGAAIGLCILAKSILGFFPLVVTVLFLLLTRQWRMLIAPSFLGGTLLALATGCSWYLHETLAFGSSFLQVHFQWLIFQRGFTDTPQAWQEHLSYLKDILTYYWPWLPLLVVGIAQLAINIRRGSPPAMVLLLWFLVPIAVMSVMNARVLWYIMPVFPAAAVIGGSTLAGFLRGTMKIVFAKAVVAIGLAAFLLINATPLQIESQRETDVRTLAPYVRHAAAQGAAVVGFRVDFYGLNNALLFYSDHAASPIYDDHAGVEKIFADSPAAVCMLHTSDLPGFLRNVHPAEVIRKMDDLTLVANKPIDVSGVSAQQE